MVAQRILCVNSLVKTFFRVMVHIMKEIGEES